MIKVPAKSLIAEIELIGLIFFPHIILLHYLTVKSDLSIVPHDDRHPLAHVVEVEDAEQLMHLLHPQRLVQTGVIQG